LEDKTVSDDDSSRHAVQNDKRRRRRKSAPPCMAIMRGLTIVFLPFLVLLHEFGVSIPAVDEMFSTGSDTDDNDGIPVMDTRGSTDTTTDESV
jgi:hypothetical protein